MGIASRLTSRALERTACALVAHSEALRSREGEEEEEEEENQVLAWVPGQLHLMTPLRFSLRGSRVGVWVLPEVLRILLGDDLWIVLVFSFAWFDSGYMHCACLVWFCGPLYLAVTCLMLRFT